MTELTIRPEEISRALSPIEAAAVSECLARLDRLAAEAPAPLPEAPGTPTFSS